MICDDEVSEGSGTIFATGEMQQYEEYEEFSPLLDMNMSHDASISLREHVNSLRDNIVTPFEYNGDGDTERKEEQVSLPNIWHLVDHVYLNNSKISAANLRAMILK